MVDALAAALAVQEDLGCLIAHQECRLFLARLTERVEASSSVEWVERADEDDVRPAQLRVELTFVQHVHVHHRLQLRGPELPQAHVRLEADGGGLRVRHDPGPALLPDLPPAVP